MPPSFVVVRLLSVTTYTLRKADAARVRTDIVVIGVAVGKGKAPEPAPGAETIAAAYGRGFAPMLAAAGMDGTFGSTVRLPTNATINAGQLLIVGLGETDALTPEKVRRAAGIAGRAIGNVASATLALPATDAAHVRAVVEGFSTGLYRFDTYKSGAKGSKLPDVVILTDAARRAETVTARDNALVLAKYADQARDWVNTPPNALVPTAFAEQIRRLAKDTPLDVEVLTAAQLKKLGCGGIIGVGQGSANPPCLVKLTWRPAEPRGSVALVGKGITFDSGGLTLKPGGSMPSMKSDMAGAATVVAAIHAIAAQNVPVAVTAYVPIAENMVGGNAQRPGDVLTMLSGKTVEVTNTDAEGRLVLADALTMAVRDKPEVIINVATLTGACVVALGDRIAGLFGDQETTDEVIRAADRTGELFWPLPIPPEQRTSVRTESKVADLLQANWVRWGGALYAAAFLEQFVDDVPWAHLDVAGPAYNSGGPWGHVPSGGTGFAISTIVELVTARAKS